MKRYEINKTFDSEEKADKWEEKNVADRVYNGEPVLMVSRIRTCGEDEVTITEIVTV